jgi:hypothetical protein
MATVCKLQVNLSQHRARSILANGHKDQVEEEFVRRYLSLFRLAISEEGVVKYISASTSGITLF